MSPSALLFDLDGTLVDSVPDLAAAVNALLAEHGRPPLDRPAVAGMVGDGTGKLVERALAATGGVDMPLSAAVDRFLALYEAVPVKLTRPYPDVPAVLERLGREGYRLALCTNKPERVTHAVLEGLGLDRFFPLALGGDSLPLRKPDPAPLLFALERLGVGPAAAAMVGDHRNDVLAAKAAGMPAIFARYGYGLDSLGELRPEAVIDHFADLPAVLRALPRRAG